MQVTVLYRRISAVVTALCLALLLLVAAPWTVAGADPAPSPAPPPVSPTANPCAAQTQAANDLEGRIDAHNAQPHTFTLPQQQGPYDAYNAEANRLNGEKDAANANLKTCANIVTKLENNGTIKPPTQDRLDKIRAGIDSIPSGFQIPATPPTEKNRVTVMPELEPLYEELREQNPGKTQDIGNVPLQGQSWPEIGSENPVYPPGSGKTIQSTKFGTPAISADHIVPLAELLYLPGFLQLPPELMYQVVLAPLNLQWLPTPANIGKNSGSANRIKGADPDWVQKQVDLQNSIRDQLIDLIAQMLKTLGSQP